MSVKDIRTLEELELYEKDWNNLIEKCPGSLPMQSYAWISAYFRYKLQQDEKWICLFAYNETELIAVYPLLINRKIGIPGFYFQTFKNPFDPFHTTHVDGLILQGYESILELMLTYLKKSFNAVPLLHMKCIPEFSASVSYFNNERKKGILSSFKNPAGKEYFISLPETFREYHQQLKPKFRKKITRRLTKLSEEVNSGFIFNEASRTNRENFEIFGQMENSGWKGKKKTAILYRAGDRELFLSATNKFHEYGWIRWNFVETHNNFIAARLFVRINNTTVSFKTAYNEDYSKYAPGKLLFYKSVEYFYDSNETGEIVLGNLYNRFGDWNASERGLFNIIVFPKHILMSPIIKLYLSIKYKLKSQF